MRTYKILLTAAALSVAGVMAAASVSGAAAASEATADTATSDEAYTFTITDATNVQKHVAKIITLSDEETELYDVMPDGIIDINDATRIQKVIAKITDLYDPVINETAITLAPDESEVLTAAVYKDHNPQGSWSSSDTSVAEVDENGTVTAKSEGVTEVTFTMANGAASSCKVTVGNPVPILDKTELTLKVGEYESFSANVSIDSTLSGTWASSNSYVAEVDENGEVFAKFEGTTTITYTLSNGNSASCAVTVDGTAAKCIDISEWNGDIDFDKVKADGYEYVIIRAGYGNGEGDKGTDTRFEKNYAAAKAAGLKVGVYWYSYAMSVSGAEKEVAHCTKVLNGKELDLPLYLDVEDPYYTLTLDDQTIQNIAITFCEGMKENGYTNVGVYSSASVLLDVFDLEDLASRGYSIWSAEWNDETLCSVDCDIWQYASDGIVDGISYATDLDYIYNLNILAK